MYRLLQFRNLQQRQHLSGVRQLGLCTDEKNLMVIITFDPSFHYTVLSSSRIGGRKEGDHVSLMHVLSLHLQLVECVGWMAAGVCDGKVQLEHSLLAHHRAHLCLHNDRLSLWVMRRSIV